MPELTQLQKVKLLLGITSNDKDDLLNLIISDVDDFVEAYTHIDHDELPDSIKNQVVIYRFNMLGQEGLNSESYSGMSFSYTNDLPAALLRNLNKYRKVAFL